MNCKPKDSYIHSMKECYINFRWLRRRLKKIITLMAFISLLVLIAIIGFVEKFRSGAHNAFVAGKYDVAKSRSAAYETFMDGKYDVPGAFLVDTLKCKIPNLSPFTKEAMNVFSPVTHLNCTKTRPLVELKQFRENDTKLLVIHDEHKKDHLSFQHNKVKCCYRIIYRSKSNETADNKVEYSSCRPFNNRHELDETDEFILVECAGYAGKFRGWKPSSIVYRDVYAIIRRKKSVEEKLARHRQRESESSSKNQKHSVLFFGIDSISRLNLIRALPQTYQHVESTGWFELRGYNKMEDGTIPNLMAIFTGHDFEYVKTNCNWRRVGELENCEFMWNLYERAGYVTALAEDEAKMSTFNYFTPGFLRPPTDYYLRPLTIAAENNLEFKVQMNPYEHICVGRKNYADYIYDFGVDLATTFKNESKFGFFWTNSFSHEDLSVPSSMDEKVKGYLEQWESAGILNSSIVFFISDHGMRRGKIRKHFTGWLEERLPFFYVWLPPSFRQAHPDIVRNLQINRDRLTSPYDVHVTLKHILQMSGVPLDDDDLSAESCPHCMSLFKEVPENRTCEDVGVEKHWCTCTEYQVTDKTSKDVKNAVNYVIDKLNSDLKEFPKCAQLRLHSILSARKSTRQKDFIISFQVKPSDADFEVTVHCDDTSCESVMVLGSISRLNRYGDQSDCINEATLRKYCFCQPSTK